MTPEQIVRALAARPWDGQKYCPACDMLRPNHYTDCPWRLAVEWVAAQDVIDPSRS